MTYFKSTMDEEQRDEADRLLADERREREPEEPEDSPLVRFCRTQPEMAAAQISALQDAVREMAPVLHYRKVHWATSHARFEDCREPQCRKLRDRLRPL